MPVNFLCLFYISFYILFSCDGATIVKKSKATDCSDLSQEIIDDIAAYSGVVNQIIDYYLTGPFKGETYKQLADFLDKFGPRPTGSQALEDSIDYIIDASNRFNLDNVHKEPVEVPHWIRGPESLTLNKPREAKLPLIGVGLSVSTPPGGITAKAIVVQSFEELRSLNDSDVAGKIVVFDQPWISYAETGKYRGWGANEAAKKGGIAALIRSATPFSLSTLHTGMLAYEDGVTQVPAACITHEDADMLWRMQNRSEEIELTLKMPNSMTTAISHNVVSELKGVEDKYVIVGGHIDSWDNGDGAMDDGAGCMISWLAPIAMKNLNMKPRRTVRTVLFTAEEQISVGAIAYEEQNRNESDKYSFVMESDFGTLKPLGIVYDGGEEGECIVREVLKLFDSINATQISFDVAGPDVAVWTFQGIPGGGYMNDEGRYFWYHHTSADRINAMDSDTLDLSGGFWTAFAYVMADMKYEIPRTDPIPMKTFNGL